MQSNNNIYSFFIGLALLFWNPFSYFLIYGDTQFLYVREHNILYWIYSILFLSGITLIYLIKKNKFNETIKNIIFTIAFVGILFSSLVVVDRFIGLASKNEVEPDQTQPGLIFQPKSKARYQTLEFDFVANINSLGLRDREIPIEKADKYRILCFGDSHTFGWGVNVENSWPKKLEQYLLANGYENIEVINCGRGGEYTSTYKKYLGKAVPLLKPDLVLVGALQLDDLAQLFENNFITNQPHKNFDGLVNFIKKLKIVFAKYLKYSFKNILSLRSNRKDKTVEIKSNWETSANSMIKNFSHLQKVRFYTLDEKVQSLFKSGNLNASLLNYYIHYPDRTIIFNNPNHSATEFSTKEMNKDFREMKYLCDNHNANLIFVNLATNYFTGHTVIRTPTDFLNSYFEKNNNIDAIYRSIANANNLPYIELTKHFIGLKNKSAYFFRYDGHPNEKGYEEIARYVGKQLIQQGLLRR